MKLQQQKPIVKTCLNSFPGEQQENDQQTVVEDFPKSLVYSAKHSLSMLTSSRRNYSYSTTYLNRAVKQVSLSPDVTTQDEQLERSSEVKETLELVLRKMKLLEIDIKRNKAITELTQCLYLDLKAKINSKKKGILHE